MHLEFVEAIINIDDVLMAVIATSIAEILKIDHISGDRHGPIG